jgi:hypothetical protein
VCFLLVEVLAPAHAVDQQGGGGGVNGGNANGGGVRKRLSVWSSSSTKAAIPEHSRLSLSGVEAASRAGSLQLGRAGTSGLPNDAPPHHATATVVPLYEVAPSGKSATSVTSIYAGGGVSAVAAAAAADAALLTLPSSDKRTPSLPLVSLLTSQPSGAPIMPGMVSHKGRSS